MADEGKLQKLLQSINPFKRTVVGDPWQCMPDERSIHGFISDELLTNYREVAHTGDSHCVLLLGEPGLGKTHLMMRFNRQVGTGGLFVYVEPFGDASSPFRHILRRVMVSLCRTLDGEQPSNLKRFIGHVISHAMADVFENFQPWKGRPLYGKLAINFRRDPLYVFHYLTQPKTQSMVASRVVQSLQSKYPQIDVEFFEVLLRVLDPELEMTARKWLQGVELPDEELERLQVKNSISDDYRAFEVIRSIGCLAAGYHPLVLVFDQIESLRTGADSAAPFIALGNAIARLRNYVPSTMLVACCLKDAWVERLRAHLERSVCDRMEEYTFTLQTLRKREVTALVAARMDEVLPRNERPTPYWPFTEETLNELFKTPTPRLVLRRGGQFLSAWRKDPQVFQADKASLPKQPERPAEQVVLHTFESLTHIYTKRLATEPPDEAAIGGALRDLFVISARTTRPLAGRLIEQAEELGGRKKRLGFTVTIADKEGQSETVGVALHFTENGRHFSSRMRSLMRVIDGGDYDRIVLLRDSRLAIPRSWKKGREYVCSLVALGGLLVALNTDEQVKLLAARALLNEAASGSLFAGRRQLDWLNAGTLLLASGLLENLPTVAAIVNGSNVLPDGYDPFGVGTRLSLSPKTKHLDENHLKAVEQLVSLLRHHKILSVQNACSQLGTDENPLSISELNTLLSTCAHKVLLVPGKAPILRYRPDNEADK